MAAVLTTFAVSTDIGDVPLDGVLIRIYDNADAFVAEGVTGQSDPTGTLVLLLNGSVGGIVYKIRLFKSGVSYTKGPTQFARIYDPLPVNTINTFDVEAHVVSLAESSDVDLCRVSGCLTNASLQPLRYTYVEFTPVEFYPDVPARSTSHFPGCPSLLRDRVIAVGVTVLTDRNGFFTADLPRLGGFRVHMHGLANPVTVTEGFLVPDAAGARFEDLLFNYVKSVSYAVSEVDVAVGGSINITVDVRGSNGHRVEEVDDLAKLLLFAAANGTIARVAVVDKNTLRVEGLAVGSTSIAVSRLADTYAPRRPEIAGIITTSPGIVVAA